MIFIKTSIIYKSLIQEKKSFNLNKNTGIFSTKNDVTCQRLSTIDYTNAIVLNQQKQFYLKGDKYGQPFPPHLALYIVLQQQRNHLPESTTSHLPYE